MSIGILYIGIGRYACLWPEFYATAEQKLMPGTEKHYYVFTDGESIQHADNVSIFHQDDMGWPLNTLFRFKMFLRIKEQLAGHDYLFFFNANTKIVQTVTCDEFLPQKEDYTALCMDIIQQENGVRYNYSGAMNGGKADKYLELITACNEIADTELAAGRMPTWHDETILNWYLEGKDVHRLDRVYGKPANWSKPEKAKIILRTKEKVMGRSWLRNYKGREHTNTWLRKLLRKIGLIK